MGFDIMRAAQAVSERAIELRRRIHRHPEIGNDEQVTSALIAETLTGLGWEVARPMGTAVVGLLRGGQPGRTVALRADMDALRIDEATDLPFSSEVPHMMHACGHDVHCAGLLGAAMVLAEHRSEIKGNVKLFFQPDEEGQGGAARMIQAGVMEDPRVDAVFGAHVDPELPAGHVGFKYGKMYAASDTFRVVIHGVGCHGASPSKGIDAIAIGAQVVSAVQQIVSRRVAPTDSAVITIGSFHGGSNGNVICDRVEIEGILRTLGREMRLEVRRLFTEAVQGICAAMGAQAEIHLRESHPGIVNWNESVELAKNTAEQLLGADKVHIIEVPTMASEDFGCFVQDAPGAFFKIGVRNEAMDAVYPIHSAKFKADEAAIPALIAMHVGNVLNFLNA